VKAKKSIVSSIFLSVLIHAVLLSGIAGIKVTAEHSQEVREKKKKSFDVKAIQKDVVIKKPVRRKEIVYVDSLKFEQPGFTKAINKMVEDEQTVKKEDDVAEKKQDIDLVNKLKSQAIDELKENEKNKVEFRKKAQRDTAEDIISDEELDVEQMIADQKDFLKQEDIPKDFYEKMPGFTPERSTGLAGLQKGDFLSSLIQGHSPVIKRAASIEDIRKELVWSYSTYQDPEDGQKYFKISIGATRSNVSLVKIPKEIVFLIDCSISIEQDRLEEFKKGISYCLKHLNEEDRFNIMAFKEVTTKFKSSSVNPTEQNIEDALDFVGNLRAGEKTDTYNALFESINVRDAMTPSYIFLLSDGRPTKGVVNSRKVINKISQLNKGKISIFAFSGGLRVNRYLLDFISYKNRGWAQYANRGQYIGQNLASMYEKIKEPLLIGLRYYVNGLDQEEIFPKLLPDFFRNVEFTLYGKYEEEKEFSLQLLGEAYDEHSEFIINGMLQDAKKGDRVIARNWAFNKIYHLIGELSDEGDNTAIIAEIKALSDKFGIQTPYSNSIIK